VRYRKKPVVVEAFQWQPQNDHAAAWPQWAVEALAQYPNIGYLRAIQQDGRNVLEVRTLEGKVWAREGDWVVRGVEGELYPVKDSVFRATYEPGE